MRTVSLLPARGGSKGIPNKNIAPLNGKPLIYYAIRSSLNSESQETWVSTDNDEIKRVSIECGARVIDRPAEISKDYSQSEEALLHFCSEVDFDTLVFIQPTSPLVESTHIDTGIQMMNEYDSVFSVYKEHWVPRWTKEVNPDGWDVNNRPMRQQMDEKYVENGAFYITKKENLLQSKLRYSGKIGVVEMPLHKSFQIDTEEDLALIGNML